MGLDCAEELPLLEAALARRELWIKSATLVKIGCHVDQSFELMPASKSPKQTLNQDIEVTSASAAEVLEAVPHAAAALPANMDQVMKLSVDCPARGGERAAVMRMMNKLRYRLITGILKTDLANGISDIFFITPDLELSGSAKTEDLLAAEFRLAVFSQLQKVISTVTMKSQNSMSVPPGQSVIEHISSKAKQQGALPQLPIVLRDLQRKLEYQLHGPASSGLLIDGFCKYVGIGLAQRSLQEMLGFKLEEGATPSLVLEIRTCFVSEKVAQSAGQLAEFSHLLHDAIVGTQEFANFVSWLDIPSRTWTIDRVYLNGVLPAGKRYGARAIAEHLLERPLLFFQSRSKAQIGSFLDSMPDLEKLVVSDIVNWNTYLLMAVVGTSEADTNKKVGDVLGFALHTELNAAGLSKKMLYNGSVLEVFQQTALGKMSSEALAIWNEKLNRAIKMKSAEVVYGAGDEEIFGQRRPRMAVIVQLMEEHAETRAKGRLGIDTAMPNDGFQVESQSQTQLEGMGAFLEGVWGTSHSKVHVPAGANASLTLPF